MAAVIFILGTLFLLMRFPKAMLGLALVPILLWFAWLGPHYRAEDARAKIVALQWDLNWFTMKCDRQRQGIVDIVSPDFDNCTALEQSKRELTAIGGSP